MLLAASLLTLSACGVNDNTKKDDSKEAPKSEESSIPSEASSEEPIDEGGLDDIIEPTIDLEFDNVEDNCMINPKAKTYIDQMEEQEKTLDRPYHFSSLYGPDDYAKIAAASDKGDGTTYAAADTGGVDVCQILRNTDDSGYCKNYPIKVSWDDDGSDYEDAVVKFWSKEDASDLREAPVKADEENYKYYVELPNLFRATKYRMQVVTADEEASQGFEFETGDYPRTISFGGIKNVRDIGGFMTSYGVRTNQGLMYRGYYIDDGNPSSHGKNYNEETQRVQEEVMKISVELDLQKASETGNRTKSAIDSEAIPVEYKCLTLVSYENFLKQDSYKNLPEVMHYLANADERHVYFHCWGGADRTGMLDFFVNAILGVSYTDLIEEFELTTQTNNKRCHMHNSSSAHYPKFMNAFLNGYTEGNVTWKADPDKTVNENCEKWMIEVAGVDPDDIERIREIMLPGYADGELDVNKLIPTYTPDGEWVTDDLAHWKVAKEDSNVKCNWGRHTGTECSICGKGGQGGGGQGGDTPVEEDPLIPFERVWTVTKTENNSDGKAYEQLKDNSKNKVGVRIAIGNVSSGSYDADGKLPSDADSPVTYKIKAPKAGVYQMVMNGRVSDASYMLGKRGIKVTVNGTAVDIQGDDRDGGLNGTGDNDFVIAPSVTLTGDEDVITVECRYYRIKFNLSSSVVFAEH